MHSEPQPVAPENLSKEVLVIFAVIGVACAAYLFVSPLRTFFPAVDLKMVTVTGALDLPLDEMQGRFTTPVEASLARMPEVESFSSSTMDKYARIWVALKSTEHSPDFVRNLRADLEKQNIPAEVSAIATSNTEAAVFYVSADPGGPGPVQSVLADFETALLQLSYVKSVEITGTSSGKAGPPPVTVRFDQTPVVMVTVSPIPGTDVISFRQEVTRTAAHFAGAKNGIRVHFPEQATAVLTKQICMFTAAGLFGLVIGTLLLLLLYRNRRSVLCFPALMTVAFSISLCVSNALGISLNAVTLLAYFLSGGSAFALGAMLLGFYRRRGGDGTTPLILPLGAAIFTATFSFIFPWLNDGIVETIALSFGLAYSFVLFISAGVCLIVIPHWTRLSKAPVPVPLGGYRRLLSTLFAHRKLRILAWMLPQGALLYTVLFFALGLGRFYFINSETHTITTKLKGDPLHVVAVTDALEKQLSLLDDVEHVRVVNGSASGISRFFDNFGPEYAEIGVMLKENHSAEKIFSLLRAAKEANACDISWHTDTMAGSSDEEAIYVSGDDPATGQSIVEEIKRGVLEIAPRAVFRMDTDPRSLHRRNGKTSTTLAITLDETAPKPAAFQADMAAKLDPIRTRFPKYTLELKDPAADKNEMMRGLTKSIAVVSALILLLHILAGLHFRSMLPLLLLLAPPYLASGAVLFARDIYFVGFLALPTLPPLSALVVFLFLQTRKEAPPSNRDAMLDDAEQLFRSTAPPFSGFMGAAAAVALTLPSARPFALTALGGMLLIAYFVWVLLPIFLKPMPGPGGEAGKPPTLISR